MRKCIFAIVVVLICARPAISWEANLRDKNGNRASIIVDTNPPYEPQFAALELKGDTAYGHKDYGQALKYFSAALEDKLVEDPPSMDQKKKNYLVFRRAQTFFQLGNYQQASEEFSKLPSTDTGAKIGVAESYYKLNQYEKVLPATESIVSTLSSALEDKTLNELERYYLVNHVMRNKAVRGKAYYHLSKFAEAQKELSSYKPSVGGQSDKEALEIKEKLEKTK